MYECSKSGRWRLIPESNARGSVRLQLGNVNKANELPKEM